MNEFERLVVNSALPAPEVWVALMAARHVDARGRQIRPSIKELSRLSRYRRSTVTAAIRVLRKAGILVPEGYWVGGRGGRLIPLQSVERPGRDHVVQYRLDPGCLTKVSREWILALRAKCPKTAAEVSKTRPQKCPAPGHGSPKDLDLLGSPGAKPQHRITLPKAYRAASYAAAGKP